MWKQKLCSAPILALPEGSEDFIVYYDASIKGLGAVLMQKKRGDCYASHQLKIHEKNYTTHDLELRAVVESKMLVADEFEQGRNEEPPLRCSCLSHMDYRCWVKVGSVIYKLELPEELDAGSPILFMYPTEKVLCDRSISRLALDGLHFDDPRFICEEPL
ncbi:putative reverse transcriptase domain-containing protein [Tanacetum coccineum]